jgi:hypothetical protein
MKTEYNIKDKVWVHLGERNLVEGRVVEIIDLVHLKEGHSPDRELYIIEIKTGIDDIYEVRSFEEISPDATGPINLFRKIKDEALKNQRYLKRVGIKLPVDSPNYITELAKEINEDLDLDDITPDQIHAALANATAGPTTIFNPTLKQKKSTAKKRPFVRRKKNDNHNT